MTMIKCVYLLIQEKKGNKVQVQPYVLFHLDGEVYMKM